MADSVVNLGAGAPDFSGMTMNEAMFGTNDPVAISRATRPSFDESGLGYYFQDGEMVPAADEEGFRLLDMGDDLDPQALEFEQSVDRASPYEGLADPVYPMSDVEGFRLLDKGQLFGPGTMSGREGVFVPRRVEMGEDGTITEVPIGFQEGGAVREERGIVDLPMEKPKDRGIEGLLMYEGMADPQYPLRPIQKQNFSKKRGFQYGQMVQLDERDEAVGGKLLKQAGIQASVDEVRSNLDPKIVDQMSRILGRNIG